MVSYARDIVWALGSGRWALAARGYGLGVPGVLGPGSKGLACALTLAGALTLSCANVDLRKQQHLEAGTQYLAKKQYREAIVELRNAVKLDERFGEARFKLAEAYAASGNPEVAYGEYIRAADLLPDRADAQIKAARYLLMARQFQDARTRIEGTVKRDPKNIEAKVVLGTALAGLNDYEGAITEIEQAIQVDPKRSASHTNLALIRLAQGEHEAARKAFQDALAIDERSVPALLAFSNFEWALGNMPAAEQHLKRALTIAPKDTFTNRALAAFYLATGRPAQAEPHLLTVVEVTNSASARFALADYYILMRRAEEAKPILRRLRRQNANFVEAELRLAAIEYGAGNRTAAHDMVDKVLTGEPNNAPVLLFKARWLFDEGKRELALERARAAVQLDPKSIASRYLVGTIQAELGDYTGAIASFSEVLRVNPRTAAAQVQLARLHLARHSTDTSVQFAEQALRTAPGSPEARLVLARGLIVRGEFREARAQIDALRKAFPRSPAVYSVLGALELAENRRDAAAQAFEQALKLDPRWPAALTEITKLDLAQNRVAQARARIEAALRAGATDDEVLVLAADVYRRSGDLPRAEQILRHLIAADPRNTVAFSRLGEVLAGQQKLDVARAEFEAAAKRNPKDLPSQTMVAMILHAQNKLPEATTRYEQILEFDPHAAVAANNLAWIYASNRENIDRALELATQAAERLPDRAEVHDTIGWVYFQKGLASLAVAPFEQSVARAPDNPVYRYHLGLALAKSGNVDRAREAFDAALKIEPNYADARRALESLRSGPQ